MSAPEQRRFWIKRQFASEGPDAGGDGKIWRAYQSDPGPLWDGDEIEVCPISTLTAVEEALAVSEKQGEQLRGHLAAMSVAMHGQVTEDGKELPFDLTPAEAVEHLIARAEKAEQTLTRVEEELRRRAEGEDEEIERFGGVEEVLAVRRTRAAAYREAADLLREAENDG